MKKKYFPLALLLGGCNILDSSKEILPGNRQPYMVNSNERIRVTSRIAHVTGPAIINPSNQTSSGTYGNMLALGNQIKCIWQNNIESSRDVPLLFEPLATPSAVYVLDTNSNIKAFDPNTGKILWQKCLCQNESQVGGGIATSGSKIYVTLGNGDVIAMEPGGKICWRKSLGLPIRAKPLLGNNLYVLTAVNKLFAFNPETGEDVFLHEGMVDATGILSSAAPVICDHTVILPYSSGELFALHSDNGQILWVNNLISNVAFDSLSSISHIVARPIIENDAVYAISHSGILGKWQLSSGKSIWQKNIGGINTPAIAGNYMFVLSNYNELLCLDKQTGEVNWAKILPKLTANKENIIYSGPVVTDLGLILTSSCGEVLIFSAKDGEICKKIPLKGSVSLSPVVANRHLYVLQDDGTLTAWAGV